MADSIPPQPPMSLPDGTAPALGGVPSTPFPTAPAKGSRRSALLIVFLVIFIDLFGFGIVLPLLPRYADDFLKPLFPLTGDAVHSVDSSVSPTAPGQVLWSRKLLHGVLLGLLMSSFSMMQFIFSPIWGRVSDRIGRRPILLMGLASSVVFYTLFGVASEIGNHGMLLWGLILLFVSRIGAGIAGATIGTAQAVIADSTSPEHRSRGMALIGAAFGIGFFFGPLLGFGALALFPTLKGGPGFLAASLSFVAGLLGLFLLPETRRPGEPAHGRRSWFDRRSLQAVLQVPGVGTLMLIFFISTLAFSTFEPTLALLTQTRALGLSDQNNFLIFAYVGLVLALAQGVLYRRLALRLPELTFMGMGTVLMAVGLGGIGGIAALADRVGDRFATGLLIGLLAVLIVAITGFAFMVPSVQSLISRSSDPAKQGEVLGINQSANAMARILGPALSMPLYALGHVLPYAFATILLLTALFLITRFRRIQPELSLNSREALHA